MYQMLGSTVQEQQPAQKEGPDLTGIPKQMKLDFEERSGASLDDVRVQYNSEKPSRLQALAYTQGSRIYIAPGQERHLRHELVHVIQQKQGRVQATARVNGMAVNDEERLEREADLGQIPVQRKAGEAAGIVQRNMDKRGHLGVRTKMKNRMYNNQAYHWSHYSQEGQVDDHKEGTIHHIIPYETLKEFWNIIVDYYPDLWGTMMKDILANVNSVLTSNNAVYHSNYQNQFLTDQNVSRQNIENAIDQEAKILNDKAFGGEKKDEVPFASMDGLSELLDTVYTWMPGNLVIGPDPEDRTGDPGSEDLDDQALWQKWPKQNGREQYGKYKNLYSQMKDFNDKESDHKKRQTAKRLEDVAENMEAEAKEIIDKIVSLLAGQDITNDTLWEAVKEKGGKVKYQSDPIRLFEVQH